METFRTSAVAVGLRPEMQKAEFYFATGGDK